MALVAVVDRDPSGLVFRGQVVEADPATGGKVIATGDEMPSLEAALEEARRMRFAIATKRRTT